jgi:endonuclease YncB( thermonuclease family)
VRWMAGVTPVPGGLPNLRDDMPDPAYRYIYSATVVRVIDGDTVVFDVDLGFHLTLRNQPFRLVGVNARELSQPGGSEARDNLTAILTANPQVTLGSIKPDKYGSRWLADVTLPEGRCLSSVLLAGGWAAPWKGRGARPVPVWPRETL